MAYSPLEQKKQLIPQEYCYYKIIIKSKRSDDSETINLNTTVRKSLVYNIELSNPTTNLAHLVGNCSLSAISIPSIIDISPLGKTSVEIIYTPLDVMDTTVPLTFNSPQIGIFEYKIHCVASAGSADKSMKFRVFLGGEQTQIFRFINKYSVGSIDFKCSIQGEGADPQAFSLSLPNNSTTINSPPASSPLTGIEVSVPIIFEPSIVGNSRATLTVTSDKAGTYSCVLIGQAGEPIPQGPIIIKANNPNSSITLKNIFNQPVTYSFAVDNPAFVVKANETIPAKKTTQLNVQFKPSGGQSQQPISGKLSISCPSVTSTVWVYYLRGTA
jgi:uncharacterized protein YpmS